MQTGPVGDAGHELGRGVGPGQELNSGDTQRREVAQHLLEVSTRRTRDVMPRDCTSLPVRRVE